MPQEKAAAMPRSLLLLAAAITLLGHAALAGAPPRETITSEEIARQLQRELGDRLPSGRVELDLDNPSLRTAMVSTSRAVMTSPGATGWVRTGMSIIR